METIEIEVDLTGRSKLALEASEKILKGKTLIAEGTMELRALLGEKLKQKPKKPKLEKTIAPRTARLPSSVTSGFKKDTRNDEELRQRVAQFIGKYKSATTERIFTKLKLAKRTGQRILDALQSDGVIKDKWNGTKGSRHAWQLAEKVEKAEKAEKAETSVKTEEKKDRNLVDHKKFVEKATDYLEKHNWVFPTQLGKYLGISIGPQNRLIQYMTSNGIATIVKKKNNPAHVKTPKVYGRTHMYIELRK